MNCTLMGLDVQTKLLEPGQQDTITFPSEYTHDKDRPLRARSKFLCCSK